MIFFAKNLYKDISRHNMNGYKGGKEASRILGVHQRTLYQWDEKGLIKVIRTVGGKRMYDVDGYLAAKEQRENDQVDKLKIIYVRVSSHHQKDDLQRQKEEMWANYPNHTVIEDIGSGLSFKRRGLRKIIHLAIANEISEVVVAYKDRLTRFGFDLIEDLLKEYSNGKIVVLHKNDQVEPEEELVKDTFQLMNVFMAKMNGLRRYKKKPLIEEDI